ncbi:hypothetical protein TanjilG_10858 [Lupinus angustifolius]|uniref:C2 domain-containing protein n=1 Tax=Lupinus angustifolius TaxID=3871 RepID=A0A1J7G3X6_LUPAN|nr:PREDICTED: uncharacterized protein LOC109329538 [Lupinus angustifolius]OIV95038.1 hypothetical protein TanjilG_10858 [Lupinus angustifolius]
MSSSSSPANMNMNNIVLEINLISAQGLKPPSSPRRTFQTYALTWIHSDTKLRTRVDKVGGENPTWNDKFLFRVTPDFLASETSGVSVAIYAVGTFRDHLIGTVRFLISNSNILDGESVKVTPCFSAVQIRRPSGRFHGVMNIGAMLIDGSEFQVLKKKISAIGYRDLMGEKIQLNRKKTEPDLEERKLKSSNSSENNSYEGSFTESLTDGSESTETASSSTSSPRTVTTALTEWNGVRELAGAGNKGLTASGFLCCLVANRSRTIHLSPSER